MKIDLEFPDYAFEGREDACRILDNHVEEITEALVGWHKTDTSQAFNLGDADGYRPIFGQRQQYLPLVGRMACQVLILAYGDYVWINVDPQNICLN